MTDELLQSAWQQMKAPLKHENKLSVTITEIGTLKKKIRSRNYREVIAAVFVIVFFGAFAIFSDNLFTKAGALIIVLSAIMISIILWNRKEEKADLTLPPVEYLYQHLDYLKKEARLLNTVIYWYVLPLMTGLALFFIGHHRDLWHTSLHFALLIFISVAVLLLNKGAVKMQFTPLIIKLEKLLEEEKTSSDKQTA